MLRILLVLTFVLAQSLPSRADELVGVRWSAPAELERAIGAGLNLRFAGPGIAFLSAAEGVAARAEAVGLQVVVTDRASDDQAWYLVGHLRGDPPAGATLVHRGVPEWALLRIDATDFAPGFDEQLFLYPLPDSYSLDGLRPKPAPRIIAAQGLAGLAAVEDLVGQVEDARVRGHVRALALLDTAGSSTLDNLRTRFCLRPETHESTGYIRSHLAEVLGEEAVTVQAFALEIPDLSARVQDLTPADDLTMYNVVGELPGTDPDGGYYVICAHYDAIGVRTPGGWNWRTDPAPGADDNATGVAVVLESARILSQVRLPWSIRFILWSGEELGLHGSREYAANAAADDDRILGVINVDMVGYNWDRSRVELVTNPASRWMVDLMANANERYDIGLQIDVLEDAFAVQSDHAPFWARGYDAILAIENWLPSDTLSAGVVNGDYVPYATYHSTADVPDSVNWELVGRIARLTVATLGQYGDRDGLPDLAVFSGDAVGDLNDDLRVSIANLGKYAVEDSVRVRVSHCRDDSSGCEVVFDEELLLGLPPGGSAAVIVPWRRYGEVPGFSAYDASADAASARRHSIQVVFLVQIDPDGSIQEADRHGNAAFQRVQFFPATPRVYPNPWNLAQHPYVRFAGIPRFGRVQVFTVAGELVWEAREEEQSSLSNEIRWSGVNAGQAFIADGVYIYTVTSSEGKLLQRDKIAVIR